MNGLGLLAVCLLLLLVALLTAVWAEGDNPNR